MQTIKRILELWGARPLLILAILATIWMPMSLLMGLASLDSEDFGQQVASIGEWFGTLATAAMLSAFAVSGLSYGQAMGRGFRAWSRYLVARLVADALAFLALLLLVIPGLYLFARLAVVGPVVVLEGVGVRQALSRSLKLTRGKVGRIIAFAAAALGIGLVGLLIAMPIYFALSLASPLIAEFFLHFGMALTVALLSTGVFCLYEEFKAFEEFDLEPVAPPPKRRSFHWLGIPLVLIAGLLPAIQSSWITWNDVPAGSMQPTILPGDRVMVDRDAYDLRLPFSSKVLSSSADPQRGDVVIFRTPENGERFVKRVIGLPGDRIETNNYQVKINDTPAEYFAAREEAREALSEALRNQPMAVEKIDGQSYSILIVPNAPIQDVPPTLIPEGHYFVLGDHRSNSRDSRHFGFVPRENFDGRVTGVALSFDRANSWRPRWSRFFTLLR